MISNNVYLRFDTFDDEKSVLNFINEEKNFKCAYGNNGKHPKRESG